MAVIPLGTSGGRMPQVGMFLQQRADEEARRKREEQQRRREFLEAAAQRATETGLEMQFKEKQLSLQAMEAAQRASENASLMDFRERQMQSQQTMQALQEMAQQQRWEAERSDKRTALARSGAKDTQDLALKYGIRWNQELGAGGGFEAIPTEELPPGIPEGGLEGAEHQQKMLESGVRIGKDLFEIGEKGRKAAEAEANQKRRFDLLVAVFPELAKGNPESVGMLAKSPMTDDQMLENARQLMPKAASESLRLRNEQSRLSLAKWFIDQKTEFRTPEEIDPPGIGGSVALSAQEELARAMGLAATYLPDIGPSPDKEAKMQGFYERARELPDGLKAPLVAMGLLPPDVITGKPTASLVAPKAANLSWDQVPEGVRDPVREKIESLVAALEEVNAKGREAAAKGEDVGKYVTEYGKLVNELHTLRSQYFTGQ